MTQVETTPLALAGDSEPCTSCSAPMASDQRYCLSCGVRGTERRVPVDTLDPGRPASSLAADLGTRPAPAFARFGGSWGVAALVLVALGVGVVIGSRGNETQVAGKTPSVTISGGALGGATGAAAPVAAGGAAADEWPDQDGFTVQLGELAAGTDQAAADAAKAAATAKGAEAPGVLDAGAHGLTAGSLVLYDGVFETRKLAETALKPLKKEYPDARVIKVAATSSAGAGAASDSSADAGGSSVDKPATVSKSDLKASENLDPAAFQKKSKKLPKTTALPGKPPPKDNAAPGGGSDAESIG